jgi:hypothetical protein
MARDHVSVDLTPDSEEGLSGVRYLVVPGTLEAASALAAVAVGSAAGVSALVARRRGPDDSPPDQEPAHHEGDANEG